MKTIIIQTTDTTMDGMSRICFSLLAGPLKNPKLAISIMHRKAIEDFLHDYQESMLNSALHTLGRD